MSTTHFGASLDVRFGETVGEFVQFLDERGLSHVEIRQSYLDVHPESPSPERLRELADARDVTYTIHSPHKDLNLGNQNERLRRAAVDAVRDSLDFAAAAGAGAVVVHGGSVRERYPERVRARAREQAVRSLRECATYADEVEVPLCLENQRDKRSKRRNTATPERLRGLLDDVGVESDYFGLTFDVGHAKVSDVSVDRFVDEFGDRIRIAHLHDNDGTGDDHEPLPEFRDVAGEVGADYNVLEMKSLADIDRCVSGRE